MPNSTDCFRPKRCGPFTARLCRRLSRSRRICGSHISVPPGPGPTRRPCSSSGIPCVTWPCRISRMSSTRSPANRPITASCRLKIPPKERSPIPLIFSPTARCASARRFSCPSNTPCFAAVRAPGSAASTAIPRFSDNAAPGCTNIFRPPNGSRCLPPPGRPNSPPPKRARPPSVANWPANSTASP